MPALLACPCASLCIEPRTQVVSSEATLEMVAPSPWPCADTMKLKILHLSLLFAATTAKDVYVEGATIDSPSAEKVVPAAKLGVNEAPAANHRRMGHRTLPSYGHLTGEEACENHDLSFQECQNVGCCQWAACPQKGAGEFRAYYPSAVGWRGGQCHSAASVQIAGNGQCTGRYYPIGQALSVQVPWERHDEDGPHCWRRELMSGASGWGGCGRDACDVCMGDCDSNADCKSGLSCFQRNDNTPVPGCSGDGVRGYDYCVVPELAPVRQGRYGWEGCGTDKCDVCMGNCDSNEDCKPGLSCFHRLGFTKVPGCFGDGARNAGYCIA